MRPEDIVESIKEAVGNTRELHYLAAECLEKASAFYAEKKQHHNARLLYEAAAQYAPKNVFSAIRAAELLAEEGNVAEAREQLTALLQKEPCESIAAALQQILLEHATDEERLEFWNARAAQETVSSCVSLYYGCELAHVGRYEQALDAFMQAQKTGYDSTEMELRMRIVQRAIEKEVPGKAIHEFVMQEHPELTVLALHLLLQTAQTLNEQKQFVVAESLAREALNLSSEMEAIWLSLGKALASQGKLEATLEVYIRAFSSASTCKQLALRMDALFDQTGDLQLRHDTWRALVKQHPENEVVQLHWGMACESIGAYEKAREAYSKIVDAKEFSGIANIRLGGVLACLGEVDAGCRKIETAVAADESMKSIAAWVCQKAGQVLMDSGKADQAIRLYKCAAGYAPDDPFPWLKIGDALRNAGKTTDATDAYRHVIQTDVTSMAAIEASRQIDSLLDATEKTTFWGVLAAEMPEALLPSLRYGLALAAVNNTDAAVVAERLLNEFPENAEVQLLQGIVWCGAEKIQEGIRQINQAIEKEPHLAAEGAVYLAALAKKANSRNAPVLLRQAIDLDAENLAYTVMLGEALLAGGENQAAMEEFRKVLMQAPESPRSATLLNEACKGLGKPGLCRSVWQEIIDTHPEAQIPRKFLAE